MSDQLIGLLIAAAAVAAARLNPCQSNRKECQDQREVQRAGFCHDIGCRRPRGAASLPRRAAGCLIAHSRLMDQ
jgi:hypothetical protein